VASTLLAGFPASQWLAIWKKRAAGESSNDTETFVALKAYIDNWRWAGVPFYLRTGKRMQDKVTQVVITYKDNPPCDLP